MFYYATKKSDKHSQRSQVDSDSSDEEFGSAEWTPLSQREEWKDIVPVPQDDGPQPVLKIDYSDECALFESFWLIIQTEK